MLLAHAEAEMLRLPALEGVVNGTVGAGDSFLAGMVMALSEGRGVEDAFAWGWPPGPPPSRSPAPRVRIMRRSNGCAA